MILFYTDLHIGKHTLFDEPTDSGYGLRLDNIIECAKWIADQIREHKPKLVINGGDTINAIDRAVSITADVMSAVGKCIGEINDACLDVGSNHIVMLGNHDKFNESGDISAIDIFEYFNDILVIKEPEVIEFMGYNLVFLPHMKDYKEADSWFESYEGKDVIAFSHLDVVGVSLNSNYSLEEGIDVDCGMSVYNGHIHMHGRKGSVLNVGSPMQHRYAESSEKHGVILIKDDLSEVFIKNDVSPNLYKINDLKALKSLSDNSYVWFEYDPREKSLSEVKKKTKRFRKVYLTELKVPIKMESRVEVEGKSEVEIFRSYMKDVCDTELDKGELIKQGCEIINKYIE